MNLYFGINHHANVTKGNFKLMSTLEAKHEAKILGEAGDADFDDMIAFFESYHLAYVAGYKNWKIAYDTSLGKTIEFNALLQQLAHIKIPRWEIKIYDVYPEGTPRAQVLLPNKRSPFNSGTQYDRIIALDTLAGKIGTDASLALVKTEVLAFFIDILQSYQQHQQMMQAVTTKSKQLELLRISTAQALLANEGSLMKKFSETPERIDTYFDVHSMRKAATKPSDTGGMDVDLIPGEFRLLPLRFKGTEIWSVTNNGEFDAGLVFSDKDDLTEMPETGKFIVGPSETSEIDLSTLRSVDRYVYAVNLSLETEGQLNIIEIIT
ncbi:MAG: hypothetical protein WCQ95_13105 [Bacteroidota bacterium]